MEIASAVHALPSRISYHRQAIIEAHHLGTSPLPIPMSFRREPHSFPASQITSRPISHATYHHHHSASSHVSSGHPLKCAPMNKFEPHPAYREALRCLTFLFSVEHPMESSHKPWLCAIGCLGTQVPEFRVPAMTTQRHSQGTESSIPVDGPTRTIWSRLATEKGMK